MPEEKIASANQEQIQSAVEQIKGNLTLLAQIDTKASLWVDALDDKLFTGVLDNLGIAQGEQIYSHGGSYEQRKIWYKTSHPNIVVIEVLERPHGVKEFTRTQRSIGVAGNKYIEDHTYHPPAGGLTADDKQRITEWQLKNKSLNS